ncbi:WhiB family transcriptional regulator [Streptomyces sp. NPDC059564]|uniref:WhiB family transcriptional regulator n=1 Tax=Streptomyces sp. NPDC059564 TaxID=3346865 RepID=UPI0036C457B2
MTRTQRQGGLTDGLREPACNSAEARLFFPVHGSALRDGQVRAAKGFCGRCRVREECLSMGMDESEGIWGGTTPAERRSLHVQIRRMRQDVTPTVTQVIAGAKVRVPHTERPAVVHRLLAMGWSVVRTAQALDLSPSEVEVARITAASVMSFAAAIARARRVDDGGVRPGRR